MNQEGVSGYFTNHSLRATAMSRLLREGVDEKLIKRVTAWSSIRSCSYKRETEEQHLKVSKKVQGIKCEEKNRNKNKIEKQGTVREMESVVLNMSVGNCNETTTGCPKKNYALFDFM